MEVDSQGREIFEKGCIVIFSQELGYFFIRFFFALKSFVALLINLAKLEFDNKSEG